MKKTGCDLLYGAMLFFSSTIETTLYCCQAFYDDNPYGESAQYK
jgi:hypothetical protein